MRCTVLGGQGFVGRNLIRYLESEGWDIFSPERDDTDFVKQPLGHVFYCIGLTGDFRLRPFDTVRAHVTLLAEILEHAEFESFLYLSSTRLYNGLDATGEDNSFNVCPGNPSDLYNLSKLMGESLCLSNPKKQVRIARLSNVIGVGMGRENLVGSLLQDARSGMIRLESHPTSAKDYILIQDVVRLLMHIARDGRERIYNVGSGMQVTHQQWLNVLQDATGCNVQVDLETSIQSFPAIDTRRIQREFGFKASPLFDVIPQLIKLPSK